MSKNVLTATLAAFACAAVVGAQAPPPQQVPAPNAPPTAAPTQRPPDQKSASAPDQKSASADNLIVTGCLERRAAASIATPGPAGAPAGNDAPSFVLTKVMRPTGTAGSSSAAAAAGTYRLDADASKLSSHVGEKVEITGMLNRSDNSSKAAGAGADAPQLKVDSVKMIAKTCTE